MSNSKLYFRYGVMGSSKTAQALITEYNYKKNGLSVLLLKPATDTRDGKTILKSRIGLQSEAVVVKDTDDVFELVNSFWPITTIIADESQFFTAEQIDALRRIVDEKDISVFCYGLRTDFSSHLFEGSKRLMELADDIEELKTICSCGNKAIISARIINGTIVDQGETILLGGNETYKGMCHRCWMMRAKNRKDG